VRQPEEPLIGKTGRRSEQEEDGGDIKGRHGMRRDRRGSPDAAVAVPGAPSSKDRV
jgi:hypothetical protein